LVHNSKCNLTCLDFMGKRSITIQLVCWEIHRIWFLLWNICGSCHTGDMDILYGCDNIAISGACKKTCRKKVLGVQFC
jgi:hypothetical protein